MNIEILSEIKDIDPLAWNALVEDSNPFLSHAFLHALEAHDCASSKFGWQPCHLAVYQNETLVGAMPMYLKTNTYGEFVFDVAWQRFYQQHGVAYFPKLVSSVPYTPVTGQRLLSAKGMEEKIYPLLLEAVKAFAEKVQASGWHGLFLNTKQHGFVLKQNCMTRYDCQYHWYNNSYSTFEDFLATLKHKKRKNIRQERRAVENQQISFRVLSGHTATEKDWHDFSLFYQCTFEKKRGMATLNEDFFKEIAREIPEQIVLILADKNEVCIAGALCYKSETALYGRHWGCLEEVAFLHFEACYYQGIEYCIQHGLKVFEPGAQGEYKIARGFVPVHTQSGHWLRDERFVPAIKDFSQREQAGVLNYINNLAEQTAYKEKDA